MRWIPMAGIVLVALVGVGQVVTAMQEATDGSTMFQVDPLNPVEGEPPIEPGPAPMPIEPMYQPLVDFTVQDLATRLAIDPTTIEPLEARSVVWPDGGLGCPTPGMAYIQVQVEGALVRLRVDGKLYEYHSGGARPPFLCEQPADVPPVPQPGDQPAPPPGGSTAV
ncbi:MAG TPA: hypothetical protein VGL99_18010 [Chloroflexota bacterium]|jgi:hypothetical protein